MVEANKGEKRTARGSLINGFKGKGLMNGFKGKGFPQVSNVHRPSNEGIVDPIRIAFFLGRVRMFLVLVNEHIDKVRS